jgi:hypothetical protein
LSAHVFVRNILEQDGHGAKPAADGFREVTQSLLDDPLHGAVLQRHRQPEVLRVEGMGALVAARGALVVVAPLAEQRADIPGGGLCGVEVERP